MNTLPLHADLFTAKATTGAGTPVCVSGYKKVLISVGTTGSATLTVKLQGALGAVAPAFGSAASITNQWTNLAFVDSVSGAIVVGGTGVAFSGTDGVSIMEVSLEGLDWITLNITSRSGGSATATLTALV